MKPRFAQALKSLYFLSVMNPSTEKDPSVRVALGHLGSLFLRRSSLTFSDDNTDKDFGE